MDDDDSFPVTGREHQAVILNDWLGLGDVLLVMAGVNQIQHLGPVLFIE